MLYATDIVLIKLSATISRLAWIWGFHGNMAEITFEPDGYDPVGKTITKLEAERWHQIWLAAREDMCCQPYPELLITYCVDGVDCWFKGNIGLWGSVLALSDVGLCGFRVMRLTALLRCLTALPPLFRPGKVDSIFKFHCQARPDDTFQAKCNCDNSRIWLTYRQVAQGFTDIKAYPDHIDGQPCILPRLAPNSQDRVMCNMR